MSSLNKACLIGHLGRDAELRFTQGGVPVSSFSVATTEKWTDKEGQKKESTQWHRISVWGKMAEALNEYLVKGKQVYLEGRIEYRKYTDKDGKERDSTDIRADKIVLLSGGGHETNQHRSAGRPAAQEESRRCNAAPAAADPPDQPDLPTDDDDIPF